MKSYAVSYSDEALSELREIYEYIALYEIYRRACENRKP